MIWLLLIGYALAGDELPPTPADTPEWVLWIGGIIVSGALGGIAKGLHAVAAAFNSLGDRTVAGLAENLAEFKAGRAESEGTTKAYNMLADKLGKLKDGP